MLTSGISADTSPGYFTVINTSTPSFTEPYWSNIGVQVYTETNDIVGGLVMAFGVAVAVLSVVCTYWLSSYMERVKIL